MILAKRPVHLLDVNVVLALVDNSHTHNDVALEWFETLNLQWAMCAFTEAGVLRFLTRPKTSGLSMDQATLVLEDLKQRPGYHYLPITVDWQALVKPFSKRVHGHNQVTDAYLLGLAVREGLVLTTFDKAIVHMAGEHAKNVLILESD